MRASRPLLRWLSAGILALVLLLNVISPIAGDTGTYGITNYLVTLEPQSDGKVKISYEQSWQVLSGNIPWITVGLPNSRFNIVDFSGAATKVREENSGSFTGVRIDLDKTYLAGESFNIKFIILQSNLLEKLSSEDSWRINYTPGWYDQAVIDKIEIKLISPVDTASYFSLSPVPTSKDSRAIIWQNQSLSPGERFNIIFQSSDGSFLGAESAANTAKPKGLFSPAFFIVIGIVITIGLLISWAIWKNKRDRETELATRVAAYEKEMASDKTKKVEIEKGFNEYIDKKNIEPDTEGRYYDRSFGNYITPAIWAAVILSNQNRSANSGVIPPVSSSDRRNTPSCACACVSCACACACACAGGGGAGCAKKTLHQCTACKTEKSG